MFQKLRFVKLPFAEPAVSDYHTHIYWAVTNAHTQPTPEGVTHVSNFMGHALASLNLSPSPLAETLQDVSALLTEQIALEEVFERLFDLLARVVAYDSVSIQLFDEQTQQFYPAAGRGYPDWDEARAIASKITLSLLRARWGERAVAVIADTQTDPDWIKSASINYVRSWVGASLRVKGQMIGTLNVDSATPNAYTAASADTVLAFANQAAIAIENARLRQREQHRFRRLDVINAVAEMLSTASAPQDALPLILAEVTERLNLPTGWCSLWDGEAFHLAAHRALPAALAADDGAPMHWQPCHCQRTLLSGEMIEPVTILNCERLMKATGDPHAAIRHASIPIHAGADIFGVLNLAASYDADSLAPFDTETLSILSAIGHHLGVAFARARWFAEMQAHASDLGHLYTAAQEMAASLEPQVLLDLLARHLTEALQATSGYILEVDVPGRTMMVRAEYWSEAATPTERTSDLGRVYANADYPTVMKSVLSGQVTNLLSTQSDLSDMERQQFDEYAAQSMLFVPITAHGYLLGEAEVWESRAARRFTPSECRLALTLASHAAGAIENARLFAQTRQREAELSTLLDVARAASSTLELSEVLKHVAASLIRILNLDGCAISDFDPRARTIQTLAVYLRDNEINQARESEELYRLADYPTAARALDRNAPTILHTDDTGLHPAEAALLRENGLAAMLMLPLHVGGHAVGLAELYATDPRRAFSTNDIRLGRALVDHAANAIANARLYRALQHREDYLRRRTTELEALVQVASALRAANSRAEIQAITLDHTLNVLRTDTGMLLDPESGQPGLRVAEARGAAAALRGALCLPSNSMSGRAFMSGQTHILDYLTTQHHTDDTLERRLIPEHGAGVSVLLRSGETLTGVMFVGAAQAFMDEELRLLTAIAEMAGNALHRAGVLETLEQRVAERTHDLAKANERLTELDRLRDLFVSNVSHELRTPLTNISLHLSVLGKKGSTGMLLQRLPILQRETRRLTNLIEDLLTISRLEQGRAVFVPEPYLLDSLLDEVVQAQAARAEAKRVTLQHEPNWDVPPAPVDRAAMLQVLTNLIGNAVAYTPADGHVVCRTYQADSRVVVEVRNLGVVIPPEDMPHLFERFFRGKTGQASGEPGTGLGLSISKEIVEHHGGQLEVESRSGTGTTFRCYLPLK